MTTPTTPPALPPGAHAPVLWHGGAGATLVAFYTADALGSCVLAVVLCAASIASPGLLGLVWLTATCALAVGVLRRWQRGAMSVRLGTQRVAEHLALALMVSASTLGGLLHGKAFALWLVALGGWRQPLYWIVTAALLAALAALWLLRALPLIGRQTLRDLYMGGERPWDYLVRYAARVGLPTVLFGVAALSLYANRPLQRQLLVVNRYEALHDVASGPQAGMRSRVEGYWRAWPTTLPEAHDAELARQMNALLRTTAATERAQLVDAWLWPMHRGSAQGRAELLARASTPAPEGDGDGRPSSLRARLTQASLSEACNVAPHDRPCGVGLAGLPRLDTLRPGQQALATRAMRPRLHASSATSSLLGAWASAHDLCAPEALARHPWTDQEGALWTLGVCAGQQARERFTEWAASKLKGSAETPNALGERLRLGVPRPTGSKRYLDSLTRVPIGTLRDPDAVQRALFGDEGTARQTLHLWAFDGAGEAVWLASVRRGVLTAPNPSCGRARACDPYGVSLRRDPSGALRLGTITYHERACVSAPQCVGEHAGEVVLSASGEGLDGKTISAPELARALEGKGDQAGLAATLRAHLPAKAPLPERVFLQTRDAANMQQRREVPLLGRAAETTQPTVELVVHTAPLRARAKLAASDDCAQAAATLGLAHLPPHIALPYLDGDASGPWPYGWHGASEEDRNHLALGLGTSAAALPARDLCIWSPLLPLAPRPAR